MDLQLKGKKAIVTGASRGIGRACALLAGRNGWAVGVNYREDARAADAVVEAIAKSGGRAMALKGDIAVETDVLGMFDAATKALGPLSAVIANAGIVAPTANLAEMSVERMRRVFEVNVLGAYLTAREATRRMSKSFGGEGGSIVMMSSAAARLGSPNLYVDYAGSKGAIDTLTLGLAKELGAKNIRVNSLNPGMIETEGTHAAGFIGSDFQKQAVARTPLGRIGKPDDIASAVAFLASEDSGWINGQAIYASGGFTL